MILERKSSRKHRVVRRGQNRRLLIGYSRGQMRLALVGLSALKLRVQLEYSYLVFEVTIGMEGSSGITKQKPDPASASCAITAGILSGHRCASAAVRATSCRWTAAQALSQT